MSQQPGKRTHSEMEVEKEPQRPNVKNVVQLKKKYKRTLNETERSGKALGEAEQNYTKCKEDEREAEQEYKQAKLNQPVGPKKYKKTDLVYLRTLKAEVRDKKIKEYWGNGTLTSKGQYVFHKMFMCSDLYDYFGDESLIFLSYNMCTDSFWIGIDDDSVWRFMPLSMDKDGYVTFSNVPIHMKLDQLCNKSDYKMTDAMRQKDYYKDSNNTFWITCGTYPSRNFGHCWRTYSPDC